MNGSSNHKIKSFVFPRQKIFIYAILTVFLVLLSQASAFDYSDSAFGILGSHLLRTESFMIPEGMTQEQYFEWVDGHIQTLGAHWTRFNCPLSWTNVEPVLGGGYEWDSSVCGTDSIFSAVYEPPNQVEVVAVINAIDPNDARNPVEEQYIESYTNFLKAAAERYDGDGVNDADSNIRVRYFQFINESPTWYLDGGFNAEQYAQAAETTLNALREANPDAKLILVAQGGMSSDLGDRLKDIILECRNRGVEFTAVDLHSWGSSDNWINNGVGELRIYLDSLGLTDVQIWSLENGTYVGNPEDGEGNQTETDQARSLVKRFAWGRANGFQRILWNNLLDFDDFSGDGSDTFWNNLGLIGDALPSGKDPTNRGDRRLSYWSYQLMAQYTDTLVAEQIGQMDITNGNTYGYEYRSLSSGLPLYVIWRETGSSEIALSQTDLKVTVVGLITDENGNTSETTYEKGSDPISLTVGQDPLLVVVIESSAAYSPVANAGADQTVGEGAIVTLDASNSTDPDDGIASYEWIQLYGTTVTLSDPYAVQPTFTATNVGQDGDSLTFQLLVTDNSGNASTDSTIVNVTWINQPPTANAGADQAVSEGETVILDASASTDVDDGIASYFWTRTSGNFVRIIDRNSIQASFIAPDVGPDGTSITFELTVTDDNGLQNTDTCIVNVVWINEPPAASAGSDQSVNEGVTVFLDGSGSSDEDIDTLSYLWSQTSGRSVTLSDSNAAAPTFVTQPVDAAGEVLTFQLTVTDAQGLESSDDVSVTIADNGINNFPADVLTFTSSSGSHLGLKEISGGNVTYLEAINPGEIGSTVNRPESFIYGLFRMKIKTAGPGDTAKVKFYFPESVPQNYSWFKYSTGTGWEPYDAFSSFNADRTEITLTLVDGGEGDEDGTANSEIIDPSGLAVGSDAFDSKGSGGGGGGCFISTLMTDH
jgi:K319L-like, PKD domain